MKRLTIIAIAICLSLSMALPAMAMDVDFSGYFWSRGQTNTKRDLQETNSTDAYAYMKFRLKTDFKINDNIKLTTQFDALDNKRFGEDDTVTATTTTMPLSTGGFQSTTTVNEKSNIDWDVAYATVKTPIGGFLFGRWYGTAWGTDFADSNQDPGDKITWVVPIDNWLFALQYKKIQEADEGTLVADQDWDKYYAVVNYKSENWRAGLLGSFYNLKNFVTPAQVDITKRYLIPAAATTGNPITDPLTQATAMGNLSAVEAAKVPGYMAGGMTLAQATTFAFNETLKQASVGGEANTQIFVINPYFMGTFGGLSVQAEVAYGTGTSKYTEIDMSAIAAGFGQPGDYTHYTRPDVDAEGIGAFLDVVYDFGPVWLNGGYAFASGDNDPYDNKTESFAYLEPSGDFHKLFILTGAGENGGLDQNLGGGAGNLAGGQAKELPNYGYKIWFAGFGWDAMENLSLDLLVGSSEADKVPNGYDKKHGTEYDFTATWKPIDNLQLRGVVAHLDTGDIFKYVERYGAAPLTEVVDNTTYFLEARVDF